MKRKMRKKMKAEEACTLCRSSEDDAAFLGEKIKLEEHKLCVHYFCLLTSCGVYQRGEEDEGILGFLIDDIKQETRRSSRLTCCLCKEKGACVGCNVPSCRKVAHFPCARKHGFISQFTGLFPSFCPDHSPSQSVSGLDLSLPQSCSVCLDSITPVLSSSILKCPCCHASWFHRDCVQRQAHSAGLFFFRCTLCNNKELFQEEMLRMGIYIPERDASWELESNAFSELLEVYQSCDALSCLCDTGRTYSAKSGWFTVIRCQLCGSRGTHRKCSGLKLDSRDWSCSDCTGATATHASIVTSSPRWAQKKESTVPSPARSSPDRCVSPEHLLQSLVPKLLPPEVHVEVSSEQALKAGLDLLRRPGFDPTHLLSVSFTDTTFPKGLWGREARQHFLDLLTSQIQECEVFEGPIRAKNLRLDPQALHDDLYFDVGCLLSLSLVHGGPPPSFFSRALYQTLFNHPTNQRLTLDHMTPDTLITRQVTRMAMASSVEELRSLMEQSQDFLELAGCNRPISSLDQREALVQDLVNFTLITRMQLPLHRFREGLQTLGVFNQVQLFPLLFLELFCEPWERLGAQGVAQLFTLTFSQQEQQLREETHVATYWRRFLHDCEGGCSSVSLHDLLLFTEGVDDLRPPALLSFRPPACGPGGVLSRCDGLFPQWQSDGRRLLLPLSSSYRHFKSSMEQVVSNRLHLLTNHSKATPTSAFS
ncbi:G2/M phase-specific E3 ubiquitin-protein ligase [Gouania willdenowi]|uniref:PHD-type domain-containing protein n=1 Tax=Gouania willdenowi TaxID=441366 RepID=A0A8C5HVW0_GOUWI|nr:G2/M phase-specific E3 ubiquitin-protein ligase [Gouania willdenowi]